MAGTLVRLVQNDRSVATTSTDDSGVYAFYDLPRGEYTIAAELPADLELSSSWASSVTLPSNSCAERNLLALPASAITGRLIDSAGDTVEGEVYLFAADRYPDAQRSTSTENGQFRFQYLPAGDYLLVFLGRAGFPRTFYPNAPDLSHATRIHLDKRTKIRDADIHVLPECRFMSKCDPTMEF